MKQRNVGSSSSVLGRRDFRGAAAGTAAFYWKSTRPNGGGEPPAALEQKIEASFGSVDA